MLLCNHHYNMTPQCFSSGETETHTDQTLTPHSFPLQSLANTIRLAVSMNFPTVETLEK